MKRRLWNPKVLKVYSFMAALVLFAAGCGVQPVSNLSEEGTETEIPLVEPAEAPEGWEQAQYRDLYDAAVYPAAVYPYTAEYAFEIDVVLDHFNLYPGEPVKAGDVLAYGNMEGLDEAIADLEEQIRTMEEEQLKYQEDVEESLIEPEGEVGRLEEILQNLEESKPPMYPSVLPEKVVSGGDAQESQPGTGDGGNAQTGQPGTEDGVDGQVGQPGIGNGVDGQAGQPGTGDGGDAQEKPEYTEEYLKWLEEYERFEGQYRILSHQNNVARLELENRTQLYELDHAYQLRQLEKQKKKRSQYILTSSMDGEVAAISLKESGERIGKAEPVIAVGDSSRRLIKCEYLTPSFVESLEDLYAVIDGKRYEVDYQPLSTAEYSALRSKGETLLSTFELKTDSEAASDSKTAADGKGESDSEAASDSKTTADDETTADGKAAADSEVAAGDYAVITAVRKCRRNALSVPNEAIHQDGSGKYVYLWKEDGNEIVSVTTGMSDGVYTEILSGLTAGDRVLTPDPVSAGAKTCTLEKGSFGSHFSANGSFYYPEICLIENPLEYGTASFVDYRVELYDYVEEGDVIASISVKGDTIALLRKQMELERLRDWLDEWLQDNPDPDPDELEAREEEITELEELTDEMTRDFATVEITAPGSGIVTRLESFAEGDVLAQGAVLGEIADAGNCYVVAESRGMLHYGVPVQVFYQDQEGAERTVEGRVVNLSGNGCSSALRTGNAFILVPPEVAGEITASARLGEFQNRLGVFRVETQAQVMDHVVLVPKEAVELIQDVPYVKVLGADGEVCARSFIPGGSDRDYYWTVDGLTEGMVLCLE